MSKDSRSRMVRSAIALLASRGMNATSFSEVVAASGAPRGSIYHYFPEGKTELVAEAVHALSNWVLARQRACSATSAAGVLRCFIGLWREVVIESHGASGCAVAGVALDSAPGEKALLEIVRDAFRSWVALLGRQLQATGLSADRAEALALFTVASMEGALILCRAEGGSRPLDVVAEQLLRLASPDRPKRRR
jgi:TetR/AcrR family transcriptional repressor of lmrAB and yxaGH operons